MQIIIVRELRRNKIPVIKSMSLRRQGLISTLLNRKSLSACSDIRETIVKEDHPVDGYIPKPFKVSEIVAQMQEKLGNA